jgi:CRISPR-associated protein Cmr5
VKDLERERAADALRKVMDLQDRPAEFKQRYRSYVDRFGGAVVMNGLGQALATELAAAGSDPTKEEEHAHRALADHVFDWLARKGGGVYPGAENVMEAITNSDQTRYVRAQVETLGWLTWHKKFCHAYLPKGDD